LLWFVWALEVLITLAFYGIDLRLDNRQRLIPCEGDAFNYPAISTAEVKALNSWGASTWANALLTTWLTLIMIVTFQL